MSIPIIMVAVSMVPKRSKLPKIEKMYPLSSEKTPPSIANYIACIRQAWQQKHKIGF